MIIIVWEFQVKADRVAEFERIYSPEGRWTELFNKGKGFVGSRLIRSTNIPNLFLTIDQRETMNVHPVRPTVPFCGVSSSVKNFNCCQNCDRTVLEFCIVGF